MNSDVSNNQELLDLIKNGESQTVEFKEVFRWDANNIKNKKSKEQIAKACCDFLNSQGGKIFIGIDDKSNIIGIERDLSTYHKDDVPKSKDLMHIDIRKTLTDSLGSKIINLVNISYIELEGKEVVILFVQPSERDPIFYQNQDFYVRNGPQSIVLRDKFLSDYILNHFRKQNELKRNDYIIPRNLDPLDERVDLLKKIIKNFMISYYLDGINFNNFDNSINLKIYKLTKILNTFDKSYLKEYIRPGSLKPNYQNLSKLFFGIDRESFEKKLQANEISIELIKMPIFVIAGDIALEFLNWSEMWKEKEAFYVADIHSYCVHADKSNKNYFIEDKNDSDFLEALELLVNYNIIELSGKDYKNLGDPTEWKIVDLVRLKDFIKWKSLKFLIDQSEVDKVPTSWKGYCIRCGRKLYYDISRPFCYNCFRIWNVYKNRDFPEKVCHECGEYFKTSMRKPLCDKCYYS
ncbi:MAG: helix-turn-helix domain-containing protein [Candidatus Odinarchaeota archaeon]